MKEKDKEISIRLETYSQVFKYYMQELENLRRGREEQQKIIETIVQQRDLYKKYYQKVFNYIFS